MMVLNRKGAAYGPGWLQGALAASMRFYAWVLVVLAVAFMAGAPVANAQDEFLDPEQAFVFSAAMANPTEVHVHFQVAPKYYLYQERFEIETDPVDALGVVGDPVFPPATVTYDPTFEKDMAVFYGQATVRLPLSAGYSQPFTLVVVHQGCADAGLCYPPMRSEITLTPVATGYTASGAAVVEHVPAPATTVLPAAAAPGFAAALDMGDTGFAAYLTSAGALEIILLCFVLGMLLSFTPCVLPMVPILLAILAGDQAPGTRPSRWRGVSLAAMFVLGMSVVYTILGVVAGLVGASMAVWLQTPWVLTVFAVVLGLLALAMFDVFTLQVPSGAQSLMNHWMGKLPGGNYSGVFLMGMLSALIVGPCVAAPLAGVLLFISQSGDLVLGGTALFSMAWGEGLLLLAVGASSGALMPKAGPWMVGIKQLFGVLLLATAWWMMNSVLPVWVMVLGWAVLFMLTAVIMGAFRASSAHAGFAGLLIKTLSVLLALWAALVLVGLAMGTHSVLQPLRGWWPPGGQMVAGQPGGAPVQRVAVPEFSKVASVDELDRRLAQSSTPVLLDFYADWCVSCIEMEKFTFTDPDVAERMSGMLLLQADVTKNTAADRELLKRFNLFGPPGIVFFDAEGQLRPNERVVGFRSAEKFIPVLDAVLRP